MAHPHEREIEDIGQALGVAEADNKRSGQARTLRDRDARQCIEGDAGFFERSNDHPFDYFNMGTRREFRHHAAEPPMDGVLGSHYIG